MHAPAAYGRVFKQGWCGVGSGVLLAPPPLRCRPAPRWLLRLQVLPQPSQLITVTLPRPLGIVFEEDARKKRAVVAGFVPGKHMRPASRGGLGDAAVPARKQRRAGD